MGKFVKYQHIERLGNDDVEGILDGTVHVFPKIDGTNASIWLQTDPEDNGAWSLGFGSRNRVLGTGEKDNQGFMEHLLGKDVELTDRILSFLINHNDPVGGGRRLRLYGEWLVPHTLKTYREDAWQKFYVFDVGQDLVCEPCDGTGVYHDYDPDNEDFPEEGVNCRICNGKGFQVKLLSYDLYSSFLDIYQIPYLPPLAVIDNARLDDIMRVMDSNHYLLEDGSDPGEGVVVKNHGDYRNKYGRQTWAKVVSQDFKDSHVREMGPNVIGRSSLTETEMVEALTLSLVEKAMANILGDEQRQQVDREISGESPPMLIGWKSSYIPRLLGTVYHDFVTEELWDLLKKYKQPTVDFKLLQRLVIVRTKALKPEVF